MSDFSLAPRVVPPLDPAFRPAALAFRTARAATSGTGISLTLALQRPSAAATYRTEIDPALASSERCAFAERLLKFLLWQKGAARVLVAGPADIAAHLQRAYGANGERRFDAELMSRVFRAPFEVSAVSDRELPPDREASRAVGGHLSGCRIGFDAGGSDRKVAAVIDGKEVFSCEVIWDPKNQSDPDYHHAGVRDSLRRAAEHLPRVDAIGVSSAGIHLDNRTRVASLFRKVPEHLFQRRIETLYLDVAREWGNVPVAVANDGDVTALAGAMSLGDRPVLGLALGTSLAAGYVDEGGHLAGWLNELAFAPVDIAEGAAVDEEWSGDRGTGVDYLSQSAVFRLAKSAGIELNGAATAAARLEAVQKMYARGESRARLVFETVGVYLGYAILLYSQFYRMKHVLLLGRVTSGASGAALIEKTRETLAIEDAGLAESIQIHLPDESTRRVGQAVAAASLPSSEPSPLTGSSSSSSSPCSSAESHR
jgi:predicted NBD/HSP70 family sugar kinase